MQQQDCELTSLEPQTENCDPAHYTSHRRRSDIFFTVTREYLWLFPIVQHCFPWQPVLDSKARTAGSVYCMLLPVRVVYSFIFQFWILLHTIISRWKCPTCKYILVHAPPPQPSSWGRSDLAPWVTCPCFVCSAGMIDHDIIISINGRPIRSTQEVSEALQISSVLEVVVRRQHQDVSLTVILEDVD